MDRDSASSRAAARHCTRTQSACSILMLLAPPTRAGCLGGARQRGSVTLCACGNMPAHSIRSLPLSLIAYVEAHPEPLAAENKANNPWLTAPSSGCSCTIQ